MLLVEETANVWWLFAMNNIKSWNEAVTAMWDQFALAYDALHIIYGRF